MAEEPALIQIRSLSKLYRMGDSIVRALDGVDLDIAAGEFIAITGPSGSGKSTMMHLLGCLDRPTDGAFVFNGRDVSQLSDRELAVVRNKQIGFVFQTFNLINRTTAIENVGVPLFYSRQAVKREHIVKALERVGLDHRATHRPSELSGGERQRVAIARAIVNDPLLLLADEPTGNLDTRTGEQIMQVFRGLNEQGVTIVLVTHEAEVALQARRVVQMRDGKIVSDQPVAETVAGTTRLAGAPVAAGNASAVGGGLHAGALSAAQPNAHASGTAVLAEVAEGDGRDLAPDRAVEAIPLAEPLPYQSTGRPRKAPGATGALVCGLLAPTLMLAAFAYAGITILRLGLTGTENYGPQNPPPASLIIMAFVVVLGVLVGSILGVVGTFWGRSVRRKARAEPGRWRGLGQALAAQIIGGITIGAVLLLFVIQIVACAMKLGGPPR